jgi:hypothetical protein
MCSEYFEYSERRRIPANRAYGSEAELFWVFIWLLVGQLHALDDDDRFV